MQKQKNTHWAHTTERGSTLGISFLAFVFKVFGARFCKVIMSPVLLYFYLFNGVARRNTYHYLQIISQFDDVHVKASQWNVVKIIFNFGYGIVDKLGAWTGKFPLVNVIPVDDEDFRYHEKNNIGALLLISHLGNFEMSRVASQLRSTAKFNIFMHTKNSAKIMKLIDGLNEKSKVSIIQGDNFSMSSIMNLKDKIDAGEFVVIAGDRIPVNSSDENDSTTITTKFLGHEAKFPIGPFVLSKVLECPIITLFSIKQRGKYSVYFKKLTDKVVFNRKNRQQVLHEIIEIYVKELERQTKKAPLQWYNFHKFWKQ